MKVNELLQEKGLWDNIHAKRKRGEKMRKKGEKGAPSEKDLKDSQVKESRAGVKVVQSKETQKKLRADGSMEKPGHYHKKGEDWEDTTVRKPKKKIKEGQLNEKEWSQAVTDGPARTYARKGTHTGTAQEIYNEYKRKGVSPKGLGSAIRMLTFYINRAGKNLHNGDNIRKAREMLQADLAKEHEKAEKKKKD